VREFFDAIESVPPVVILAIAVWLALDIVTFLAYRRRERWLVAHHHLQGYAQGYLDGSDGKLPIVDIRRRFVRFETPVPEAFENAWRQ